MELEFIALLSSIVGIVSVWPQYVRTVRTNNTESFCPTSTSLSIVSSLLFLVYAYLKHLPVPFLGALGTCFWSGWLLYKIKTAPKA